MLSALSLGSKIIAIALYVGAKLIDVL